jgi:hypothetical protein
VRGDSDRTTTAASAPRNALCAARSPSPQQQAVAVLTPSQLVSMRVFNGDTAYGTDALRAPLRALVRGHKVAVESVVAGRGKQAQLPRSDLDEACGCE